MSSSVLISCIHRLMKPTMINVAIAEKLAQMRTAKWFADRIAAADPKAGAAGSVLSVINHPRLNHQMQLDSGLLAAESSELLRAFFRERR